jgi:hypothetical protein
MLPAREYPKGLSLFNVSTEVLHTLCDANILIGPDDYLEVQEVVYISLHKPGITKI